jgi:hypothetical protein
MFSGLATSTALSLLVLPTMDMAASSTFLDRLIPWEWLRRPHHALEDVAYARPDARLWRGIWGFNPISGLKKGNDGV